METIYKIEVPGGSIIRVRAQSLQMAQLFITKKYGIAVADQKFAGEGSLDDLA